MAVRSLAQSSLVEPFTTNSMLAGYSGNDFHHLETVRLSSNAASVTFSNLQRYSDFQHLQIRAVLQVSGSSTTKLYFNGVTSTSSYIAHRLYGFNGSVVSGVLTTENIYLGASSDENASPFVVDILDPFDTSKNTTVRSFSSNVRNVDRYVNIASGAYFSTEAINSITFTNGTSINATSRLSLYGLKARA